jgi:hypothetical protein
MARLTERTEANVPAASTRVAPAVASDAIVAQSVMAIEATGAMKWVPGADQAGGTPAYSPS